MKALKVLAVMLVVAMVLPVGCAPKPTPAPAQPTVAPTQPAATPVPADWATRPMEKLTTVVLSVESGAQEKTLGSFAPELKEKLNIDLKVVAHPFSEQYEIQFLDLSSGAGQFDVLSFWPLYLADFAPYLTSLEDIAPGGRDQVWRDLQIDDVHPAYQWTLQYKGKLYSTQYDGDVKLLHYRRDLATDPKEHEGFKAKYGYDFDVNNLTWDQYLDVARWFMRPEQDFYGAAEIAGFLAGFFFRDRFHGMGGHFFDYNTMEAFGGTGGTGESNFDICVKAVQNGIDTFATASPPEARSFEFEDARNQIIVHNRVMFVPQWPDVWKWAGDPKLSQAVCKVSVAEMPGFLKDGVVVHRNEMNGGRVLAINKASKVKEAAYKVLVFFSDKDRTSKLVCNNETWLDPWRTTHLRPDLYSHLCQGCPENCQNYVEVIDKATAHGYPALQIPGVGRYLEVQERWAKKAWAGQVTAQEACSGMKKEFEEITDLLGRDKQIKEYQRYVDEVLKPLNLWP